MIPFLLIPLLTFIQVIIFQILHTITHFILLFLMLNLGTKLLTRQDESSKLSINLKNVAIIELVDGVSVFLINLIIPLSAGLYAISPIFILFVDLFFLNFIYSRYPEFTTLKRILLYLLAIIPTFFLSIVLVNSLFAIFGIQNAVLFYF